MKIQGDSELILKQMQGIYKVKNAKLEKLYKMAQSLVNQLKKEKVEISYEHIPRAFNKRADELGNIAMDTRSSSST